MSEIQIETLATRIEKLEKRLSDLERAIVNRPIMTEPKWIDCTKDALAGQR